VAEIETNKYPGRLAECLEDQEDFARKHGGDFIEFDDNEF